MKGKNNNDKAWETRRLIYGESGCSPKGRQRLREGIAKKHKKLAHDPTRIRKAAAAAHPSAIPPSLPHLHFLDEDTP